MTQPEAPTGPRQRQPVSSAVDVLLRLVGLLVVVVALVFLAVVGFFLLLFWYAFSPHPPQPPVALDVQRVVQDREGQIRATRALPSNARFAPRTNDQVTPDDQDFMHMADVVGNAGAWTVSLYVDSPNNSGAMVRAYYHCRNHYVYTGSGAARLANVTVTADSA